LLSTSVAIAGLEESAIVAAVSWPCVECVWGWGRGWTAGDIAPCCWTTCTSDVVRFTISITDTAFGIAAPSATTVIVIPGVAACVVCSKSIVASYIFCVRASDVRQKTDVRQRVLEASVVHSFSRPLRCSELRKLIYDHSRSTTSCMYSRQRFATALYVL
jgi:hypothetical protein